jgi:hypothetical protein
VSDRRQRQDQVAVALAEAPQGAHAVNDADIQLDPPLALGVGLRLTRRPRCAHDLASGPGLDANLGSPALHARQTAACDLASRNADGLGNL